ncbi:hypothetical protein Droror1_Dr00011407 [Drosera rotundifolia]
MMVPNKILQFLFSQSLLLRNPETQYKSHLKHQSNTDKYSEIRNREKEEEEEKQQQITLNINNCQNHKNRFNHQTTQAKNSKTDRRFNELPRTKSTNCGELTEIER